MLKRCGSCASILKDMWAARILVQTRPPYLEAHALKSSIEKRLAPWAGAWLSLFTCRLGCSGTTLWRCRAGHHVEFGHTYGLDCKCLPQKLSRNGFKRPNSHDVKSTPARNGFSATV